jgi:hypothetical protein
MTALPHHLASDPTFDFQTKTLGRLIVENLTLSRLLAIEERLNDRRDITPAELIDIFIATLAKTEEGERLTPEQIRSLSPGEKEDFAEQLVRAEDHMYRERHIEKRKNENGEIVLSHRKGDISIPREENESASAYFHRVFMKYRDGLFHFAKSVTGWASPSTISALARNATISDSIARTIASGLFKGGKNEAHAIPIEQPAISPFSFPQNPVHGTNERLDGLLERFDRFENIAGQTVELVHSMNAAASGLLEAFVEGARATDRFSRRSIRIALIALFVAIIMPLIVIGYDVWKTHQQDDDTKRVVQGIVQQIIDAQRKSSNELSSAMADRLNHDHADEAAIARALSSLSEEIRALREKTSPLQSFKVKKGKPESGH